ncbi:U-box domain-containing protein 12 [Senna tora]|uniref:U-box domain-containing protein 12 n=1 Tax=Senna tora TaxID=362788 RepID=A0A834TSW6_9FABA|nr:U-box domain-containing protein 12 [Senna tora]
MNVAEALTRIVVERQRDTEKRSAILGALMVSGDQTDRGFHSPLLVDGCETTIITLAFTFLIENRLALAQLKKSDIVVYFKTKDVVQMCYLPDILIGYSKVVCQIIVAEGVLGPLISILKCSKISEPIAQKSLNTIARILDPSKEMRLKVPKASNGQSSSAGHSFSASEDHPNT